MLRRRNLSDSSLLDGESPHTRELLCCYGYSTVIGYEQALVATHVLDVAHNLDVRCKHLSGQSHERIFALGARHCTDQLV